MWSQGPLAMLVVIVTDALSMTTLTNSSRLAREEIFGPVLAVIPYRDVADAVAIANDSDYGLGGTVWTTDIAKGLDVARRVQTGSVGVNFFDLDIGAPFGGVKASGLGHELGPEGLDSYFQLKSIYLRQELTQ
jgi:acyl-CoA reductase-like NAD-dependent aldehyde dehydrogenase